MDDNDDDFNVIERAEDTYAREAVDDNLLYRNNVDDDIDPSNTISRKRPMKIEECDQLDWHLRISLEDESAQKRIAQEIETDRALQELANRILTARKKRRSTKQGSDQVYSMCSPSSSNDTSQVILLQPPLDGTPWIGLSSTDNHRRFYVRIRPKTQRPSSANPANGDLTGMRKTGFNEKSIEKILELVQSSCHCDTSAMMMHAETVVMCEGIDVFKKPGTVTDQLWVDKYAPKNYFDLLSNEKINRTLLHWLKLWDLCVFQKSVTQLTKNTNNDITLDDGRPRRPVHKLTLLSGSPGVGKTTLASIIVMHCGYRFINVNASDERTVEDFQKCIEGALRSVRTLDLAHSPNCLIIDEIDGAPADSIKYLCKILNATGRQAIRRPVICICNNLYEKSLRELRAMALVLRVQSIEKRCLIKRLEMIARFERVPIEYSALSMIANIVDGDVRLAINSLQFIAADYELSEITCDVVQKYNDREGFMKNKSIFDAWATVFDLNRHPGVRGRLEQMTCRAERVSAIYQQFYGESDRFFLGLFTNYLATSPGTTRMSEIRAVSSYFCDYDLLIKHVLHHQNYSLMKYSYVPCVQMHYLLASVNRIHLDFPTYDQIVNQRQKQSVELLNSVKGDSLRGTMSVEVTLLDFLPLIVMIVQPPLKPMNFQMYSAYELNILHSIVATMRFYCLDYRTEHSDGISCYKFFPRIEYLAYFPLHGMGNERICYCLANSARQMISNEIRVRKLNADRCVSGKTKSILGDVAQHVSTTVDKFAPTSKLSHKSDIVIYRYHPSYSNAIRRNIRISHLLSQQSTS